MMKAIYLILAYVMSFLSSTEGKTFVYTDSNTAATCFCDVTENHTRKVLHLLQVCLDSSQSGCSQVRRLNNTTVRNAKNDKRSQFTAKDYTKSAKSDRPYGKVSYHIFSHCHIKETYGKNSRIRYLSDICVLQI